MEIKELGSCFTNYNGQGTQFKVAHNLIPSLSIFFRKGARCINCNKWFSLSKLKKLNKEQ
jgi:hypothetical protein